MVLGGLPPAFMLYLLLANRSYVIVLFTRPIGILMLVFGAVILSVGMFWMSRIVKVEV
jgi:tight adherence protein B